MLCTACRVVVPGDVVVVPAVRHRKKRSGTVPPTEVVPRHNSRLWPVIRDADVVGCSYFCRLN